MEIFYSNKNIALGPEVCLLSDTSDEKLVKAMALNNGRKLQTHKVISNMS